jgi:type IV pilus biogenesis protein CpaD/CtpE
MHRYIALLLLLLVFAGCDRLDPYKREGVWRPNGANEANLRAMVAVPADLATATPAGPADGGLAAAALDRLRHDRVRPLPDSTVADVTAGSGSTTQPTATPPPAAGSGN